jgi:Electron transfer DM13
MISPNPSSRRVVLFVLVLIVGAGLWYLFRPEKLLVNKVANETSSGVMTDTARALFAGEFQGSVHKTSGHAAVYQLADGSRILRLTDFSTSNGPVLHVLLINGQDPNASKDFSLTAIKSVDLGDLKGNQGDQDYQLPQGVDLNELDTASIYCERFHANFGTATLHKR